jgi:hypothetical protein
MDDLKRFKECPAYKNMAYIHTDGKVGPCCYFKNTLPLTALKNWDNYQTELAKQDIRTGCSHCIDLENNGSTVSHRMRFQAVPYREIGVCVDNLCNLKCTTCGPWSSSQWISDAVKLGTITSDQRTALTRMSETGSIKINLCKDLIAESVDIIKVTLYGGEPTFNPAVIDFVDWMADLPNANKILLTFVTNGVIVPKNMSYYLEKFHHIILGVSVDSIGDKNDYLRFGSDWRTLEKNIITYSKLSNTYNNEKYSFYLHYTLSLMNVYSFYEFSDWANNTLYNCRLEVTKLVGPAYYSVDVLTPKQKTLIYDRNMPSLKSMTSNGITNLERVIATYETSLITYLDDSYAEQSTISRLSSLDAIRSTNFSETFPEIYKILTSPDE